MRLLLALPVVMCEFWSSKSHKKSYANFIAWITNK